MFLRERIELGVHRFDDGNFSLIFNTRKTFDAREKSSVIYDEYFPSCKGLPKSRDENDLKIRRINGTWWPSHESYASLINLVTVLLLFVVTKLCHSSNDPREPSWPVCRVWTYFRLRKLIYSFPNTETSSTEVSTLHLTMYKAVSDYYR